MDNDSAHGTPMQRGRFIADCAKAAGRALSPLEQTLLQRQPEFWGAQDGDPDDRRTIHELLRTTRPPEKPKRRKPTGRSRSVAVAVSGPERGRVVTFSERAARQAAADLNVEHFRRTYAPTLSSNPEWRARGKRFGLRSSIKRLRTGVDERGPWVEAEGSSPRPWVRIAS